MKLQSLLASRWRAGKETRTRRDSIVNTGGAVQLRLHNNLIAWEDLPNRAMLRVCLRGWTTNTTFSRLDALGVHFKRRKGYTFLLYQDSLVWWPDIATKTIMFSVVDHALPRLITEPVYRLPAGRHEPWVEDERRMAALV